MLIFFISVNGFLGFVLFKPLRRVLKVAVRKSEKGLFPPSKFNDDWV